MKYFAIYGDSHLQGSNDPESRKKFRTVSTVEADSPEEALEKLSPKLGIKIVEKDIVKDKDMVSYVAGSGKYIYVGSNQDTLEKEWNIDFPGSKSKSSQDIYGEAIQHRRYGNIQYKNDPDQSGMYMEPDHTQEPMTARKAILQTLETMFLDEDPSEANFRPAFNEKTLLYYNRLTGVYIIAGPSEQEVKNRWKASIEPVEPKQPATKQYQAVQNQRRKKSKKANPRKRIPENRIYLRDLL